MPNWMSRIRRSRDHSCEPTLELRRRAIASAEFASPTSERPPLVIHARRAGVNDDHGGANMRAECR